MKFIAHCSLVVVMLSQPDWVSLSRFEQARTWEQGMSLERYIRQGSSRLSPGSEHRKVMAFVIRFVNFGCVYCLNDFFEFCDSLQANVAGHHRSDILLMVVRDERDEATQARIMRGWAEANGLKFPVHLVPEEVIESYEIDYTTIVVIDERDAIEYFEKFPVSAERKKEITSYLFREGE